MSTLQLVQQRSLEMQLKLSLSLCLSALSSLALHSNYCMNTAKTIITLGSCRQYTNVYMRTFTIQSSQHIIYSIVQYLYCKYQSHMSGNNDDDDVYYRHILTSPAKNIVFADIMLMRICDGLTFDYFAVWNQH